ncbi:MAG: hypothetical protein NTW21_44125, partial [Verrucomicrobia bacterium]|nr:hypothetical protein [Verrucomicrobiota bacterium]
CALPTALQTLARARAGAGMECGGKRKAWRNVDSFTPAWRAAAATESPLFHNAECRTDSNHAVWKSRQH